MQLMRRASGLPERVAVALKFGERRGEKLRPLAQARARNQRARRRCTPTNSAASSPAASRRLESQNAGSHHEDSGEHHRDAEEEEHVRRARAGSRPGAAPVLPAPYAARRVRVARTTAACGRALAPGRAWISLLCPALAAAIRSAAADQTAEHEARGGDADRLPGIVRTYCRSPWRLPSSCRAARARRRSASPWRVASEA